MTALMRGEPRVAARVADTPRRDVAISLPFVLMRRKDWVEQVRSATIEALDGFA